MTVKGITWLLRRVESLGFPSMSQIGKNKNKNKKRKREKERKRDRKSDREREEDKEHGGR